MCAHTHADAKVCVCTRTYPTYATHTHTHTHTHTCAGNTHLLLAERDDVHADVRLLELGTETRQLFLRGLDRAPDKRNDSLLEVLGLAVLEHQLRNLDATQQIQLA